MAEIFDIAVIGSGGGSIIADTAMETGHKVAMIEATGWGGTCLNRGCIPTKIMVHAADLIRDSQRAAEVALEGEPLTVDWPALKKRVFAKIRQGDTMKDYYAPCANISLYKAKASFLPKIRQAGEELFALALTGEAVPSEIWARRVVLANGGHTKVPASLGFAETGFLSSESLFKEETWPEQLPASLLIIGGGDIGTEFAHIFSSFGVRVELVQHNVRLVPKQDGEISARLKTILENNGIAIHLNYDTVRAYRKDGQKYLEIRERTTGESKTLAAEEFFICPGIRPNTDDLGLEQVGLAADSRGWIPSNEYLETSVPGIYAIGDINGRQQLRHKANYEAQVLAYNLLQEGASAQEKRRRARYEFVPAGTFTALQIGTVGLSEEKARARGLAYKVGYLDFSATAQGYAHGYLPGSPTDGFAKILLSEDGRRILGVHIIAPEASALIQPYVYLMTAAEEFSCRPDDPQIVTASMTVHPSLAELPAWAAGSIRPPQT